MKCAQCEDRKCYSGKDCSGLRQETEELIRSEDAIDIMRTSAALEADHYMQMTRVEETLEFAKNMGVKRLGVAFCLGLPNEARTFCELAEYRGFKTFSACCKIGGIDKHDVGFKKLWNREVEATCNPVGQAMALDRAGVDLTVAIGLCVGHDSVLFKYSKAPVTVLVAKDRVLSHNPVGALYSGYYRRKFNHEMDSLQDKSGK